MSAKPRVQILPHLLERLAAGVCVCLCGNRRMMLKSPGPALRLLARRLCQAYHAVNGAIGKGSAAHHRHRGHHPHEHRRHPFWSPSSFLFRAGGASPPASAEPPFSLTPRRVTPDWSVVFRSSPAAESALLFDGSGGGGGGAARGGVAPRQKLSILSVVGGGGGGDGGGVRGWFRGGREVAVAGSLSAPGGRIPSPHRLKRAAVGSAGRREGKARASAAAAARALSAFAAAAPEDGVGRYALCVPCAPEVPTVDRWAVYCCRLQKEERAGRDLDLFCVTPAGTTGCPVPTKCTEKA